MSYAKVVSSVLDICGMSADFFHDVYVDECDADFAAPSGLTAGVDPFRQSPKPSNR